MSMGKVERVFGIAMPRWDDQLRAFLAELASNTKLRQSAPRSTA